MVHGFLSDTKAKEHYASPAGEFVFLARLVCLLRLPAMLQLLNLLTLLTLFQLLDCLELVALIYSLVSVCAIMRYDWVRDTTVI